MTVTDEMIMAYVDGELDLNGRAEIETAMAADADVARRVQAHRGLRAAFGKVLGGVLDEPVPERLLGAARGKPISALDNVVDLARFRVKPEAPVSKAVPPWARWGAIAATVLVCALVGRVWFSPPMAPLAVGAAGQMVAQGALAVALNDQLASSSTGLAKPVSIGVSFRSGAGPYCRTFQLNRGAGLAGVACREADGWTVRMAMASPVQAATTGYRTAASDIPAPVLDAVQGLIQGQPLDAKGEAAAKAAGWRPLG